MAFRKWQERLDNTPEGETDSSTEQSKPRGLLKGKAVDIAIILASITAIGAGVKSAIDYSDASLQRALAPISADSEEEALIAAEKEMMVAADAAEAKRQADYAKIMEETWDQIANGNGKLPIEMDGASVDDLRIREEQ